LVSDDGISTDGIPRGRLRRTVPLARLTARTAGEAVVVGLRGKLTGADSGDFHVRTAERYAELLGNSKGALMKAGQMLSFVSAGAVVPGQFQTAYRAALARLRDDAPPMAPELARAVLERELGHSAQSAFAEFEWQPLAAASIGQVHAARLHDGRAVAVKIQYPGVADAIAADLKNSDLLFTFLRLLLGLTPGGMSLNLRGAAQEMSARITEELDYRLEAANQAEFAARYRGHPFIHIPEVIEELSSGRVLTQELVVGKPWSEAVVAEQELRDQWGEVIFRCFYDSYHRGVCNIDPHPGNYVFHDDGSVSFLDFGCVKRLGHEQLESLNAIIRACLRGDVGGTWQASVESGFFRASDTLSPEEVFEYWRVPYEHYWGEQPFTITPEYMTAYIERRYGSMGPSSNAYRHLAVPTDFTIMSRADIGAWSVLAELRSCNYWGSMAAEHFEGEPPTTPLGKLDRAFFAERERAGSANGRAGSANGRAGSANGRARGAGERAGGDGERAGSRA
jgi:predicted unusual protein kinase regulating ubiquinone biosynthesis (AarF/ABC1/UbiB family)